MTKKEIKKINLHRFVRKHLADYTVVDHFEMIDTKQGEELVESILVKPNYYKKSNARYGFKINKKDNTVTVACYNVDSINLELDYVNGINHYNDFMEKFEYHAISYSKTAEVIQMILEMGVKYKIYKNINILGFLNGIYGLLGKGSLCEDVSTFFKYDSLGGLTAIRHTEMAFFSIDKKKIISEDIGFNECISLNIPIREHEIFNIIMKNNGGVEEIYGGINDEYVLLRTDEDIKNYLREIFINAAKKSIYYKFGVEDQELNDDYLTLIEMETI